MSQQERVSWVSLLVNLVVGVWYFAKVLGLPADAELQGWAMFPVILNLIIYAIFIGILGEVLLRWVQRRASADADRTASDERDALIGLRAARNAYVVLCSGVGVTLALIAYSHMKPGWYDPSPRSATTVGERLIVGPLTPLLVAQLLLLAMTLAGITVYISRICYYRRGY